MYDAASIRKREALFTAFLEKNASLDAAAIIAFHHTNHEDYENGFVIDRADGLTTFSVTQAVLDTDEKSLTHLDLKNGDQKTVVIAQGQQQDLLL